MSRRHLFTAAFVAGTAVLPAGGCRPKPAPARPVVAELIEIFDCRARGDLGTSVLKVSVVLPEVDASTVVALRISRVGAVDDLGTRLAPAAKGEPEMVVLRRDPGAKLRVDLELSNPPRHARTLVEVGAELELYVPRPGGPPSLVPADSPDAMRIEGRAKARIEASDALERVAFTLRDIELP